MNKNVFGEVIYSEDDILEHLMSSSESSISGAITPVDISKALDILENPPSFKQPTPENITVEEYDSNNQKQWLMPQQYKDLDIAKYVLDKCKTDAELQRVGKELLLYYERNLFDLLKYLVYLTDVMRENKIIWGVGRGSSVASYVLYLIGVHKIDSIFYDLDIEEFLR